MRIAIGVCVVMLAFASWSQVTAAKPAKPLNARQIASALGTSHVSIRDGQSVSGDGEVFYRDGRYVALQDRGDVPGSFVIRGDQICIKHLGLRAPSCRRMYRLADGFYFEDVSTGRRWPIQIHKTDRPVHNPI